MHFCSVKECSKCDASNAIRIQRSVLILDVKDRFHLSMISFFILSSSSGASVVAIDNKIEQAMDLVKSHLMYAVREEVEVLKEQIKELIEKNSQLEQENNLLKTLASPEQLAQFQAQLQTGSPPATAQPQGTTQPPAQPASQGSGSTA